MRWPPCCPPYTGKGNVLSNAGWRSRTELLAGFKVGIKSPHAVQERYNNADAETKTGIQKEVQEIIFVNNKQMRAEQVRNEQPVKLRCWWPPTCQSKKYYIFKRHQLVAKAFDFFFSLQLATSGALTQCTLSRKEGLVCYWT